MCARLGIRKAYSQAYRAQANGRAEVAGKTLIGLLRKLHAEEKVNWVEVLPRVLRMYHDTVGESGMSPFQIVFGRERNLAGVPYEIPRECEGAETFLARMDTLDKKVAATLNELHRKEAQRVNAKRKAPTPYEVGAWVWVLRPRKGDSAAKLDTWWIGPCEVKRRVGNLSYQVEVKPGITQDVHAEQLKPYINDVINGNALHLFHHMTGHQETGTGPDEWNVKEILRHRTKPNGAVEFLTQWEGTEGGEETWEPPSNFITRYCGEFVDYLKKHKLNIGLQDVLLANT